MEKAFGRSKVRTFGGSAVGAGSRPRSGGGRSVVRSFGGSLVGAGSRPRSGGGVRRFDIRHSTVRHSAVHGGNGVGLFGCSNARWLKRTAVPDKSVRWLGCSVVSKHQARCTKHRARGSLVGAGSRPRFLRVGLFVGSSGRRKAEGGRRTRRTAFDCSEDSGEAFGRSTKRALFAVLAQDRAQKRPLGLGRPPPLTVRFPVSWRFSRDVGSWLSGNGRWYGPC
jgi:hypothetical protein